MPTIKVSRRCRKHWAKPNANEVGQRRASPCTHGACLARSDTGRSFVLQLILLSSRRRPKTSVQG
jgi:hypothetical protein